MSRGSRSIEGPLVVVHGRFAGNDAGSLEPISPSWTCALLLGQCARPRPVPADGPSRRDEAHIVPYVLARRSDPVSARPNPKWVTAPIAQRGRAEVRPSRQAVTNTPTVRWPAHRPVGQLTTLAERGAWAVSIRFTTEALTGLNEPSRVLKRVGEHAVVRSTFADAKADVAARAEVLREHLHSISCDYQVHSTSGARLYEVRFDYGPSSSDPNLPFRTVVRVHLCDDTSPLPCESHPTRLPGSNPTSSHPRVFGPRGIDGRGGYPHLG